MPYEPYATCPAHGLPMSVLVARWLLWDVRLCPRCHEQRSARERSRALPELPDNPVEAMRILAAARKRG